jgi:hypothetical protein
MPPLRGGTVGIGAILFLVVLLALAVWGIATLMISSTFGFVASMVIVAGFTVLQIQINRHQRRMKQQRASLSICDFAREFDARKIDPWVIRFVYEELTDLTDYPICASDHLYDDLHLDPDDVELDLLSHISPRLARDIHGAPDSDIPVETAHDLVQWIDRLPQLATHAAATPS